MTDGGVRDLRELAEQRRGHEDEAERHLVEMAELAAAGREDEHEESGDREDQGEDVHYLPFCMVFLSGYNLHKRTVPLFLRENQSYVDAQEMKAALLEVDQYYDALPDEIKERGVMQFASYPPSEMDNTVTRLWDKHMRRDWRDSAKEREADLGRPQVKAGGASPIADMRARVEQAQPLAGRPDSGDDGPGYVVIRLLVPVKKASGAWCRGMSRKPKTRID